MKPSLYLKSLSCALPQLQYFKGERLSKNRFLEKYDVRTFVQGEKVKFIHFEIYLPILSY